MVVSSKVFKLIRILDEYCGVDVRGYDIATIDRERRRLTMYLGNYVIEANYKGNGEMVVVIYKIFGVGVEELDRLMDIASRKVVLELRECRLSRLDLDIVERVLGGGRDEAR